MTIIFGFGPVWVIMRALLCPEATSRINQVDVHIHLHTLMQRLENIHPENTLFFPLATAGHKKPHSLLSCYV